MKAEFSRIPLDRRLQDFEIEEVVELSMDEFERFRKNMGENYDFISVNANKYRVDENGVGHCLLVLGKGQADGILIISEGYSYPRHTALLTQAKLIVQMEKYPSLKNQADAMEIYVDEYVKAALENQKDGCYTIYAKDLPDVYEDPQFDYRLFGEMLADRVEFECVDMMMDEIEIYIAEAYIQENNNQDEKESVETEAFLQKM